MPAADGQWCFLANRRTASRTGAAQAGFLFDRRASDSVVSHAEAGTAVSARDLDHGAGIR